LPPNLNNGLGVGVVAEQPGGNGQGAAVLAPVELLGDNGFAGTGNAGGNNVIKAAQPAQQRVNGRPGVGGDFLGVELDNSAVLIDKA